MLNPDLKNVLTGHISRYSLCTAVATRAREITSDAERQKIILSEKPVTMALQELIEGEYKIVEPEEIRYI